MAFDSFHGQTVLFGGAGSGYFGDTWGWNGTVWSQLSTTGPVARSLTSMVYDSVRGKTILFGGYGGIIGYLGDTWAWDGSNWTLVATYGPAPRYGHAMAFDAVRGRVVLFGGYYYNGSDVYPADTWEWDGYLWTQASLNGPPPREAHAMAFDSHIGKTILFGGKRLTSCFSDTWEWDGSTWMPIPGPGPTARVSHAMTYDSLRGRTVLCGGIGSDLSTVLTDTWERLPPTAAVALPYGSACGSPAPALTTFPNSRPLLGQSLHSLITNAPFGFAAVAWGITTQSLPLDFVGIDGCTLFNGVEMEIGSFCQSTSLTSAQHSLAIPYDATLLGVHVYLQAWVMAPGLNPLGIAMSNGLELVIGDI